MQVEINKKPEINILEVKSSLRALVTVTPVAEVIVAEDITLDEAISAIRHMAYSLAFGGLTTLARDR